MILGEETAAILASHFNASCAAMSLTFGAGALRVEMVVPWCAGNDLSLFRDAEPLCV
jgi:hypothetical protein